MRSTQAESLRFGVRADVEDTLAYPLGDFSLGDFGHALAIEVRRDLGCEGDHDVAFLEDLWLNASQHSERRLVRAATCVAPPSERVREAISAQRREPLGT